MMRIGFMFCILLFTSRDASAQMAGRVSFDSLLHIKWVIDTVEFVKYNHAGHAIHLNKEHLDTILNYNVIEKWLPEKPLQGIHSVQVYNYMVESNIRHLTMLREDYIISLNKKEDIGCELRYLPKLDSTFFTIDTFYNAAFCDQVRLNREKSIEESNTYYCGTAFADIMFHCIRFIMGENISQETAKELVVGWVSNKSGSSY